MTMLLRLYPSSFRSVSLSADNRPALLFRVIASFIFVLFSGFPSSPSPFSSPLPSHLSLSAVMSYVKKVLVLLLLTAFALSCVKADLVELNPENFKAIVNNNEKNVFVMFYAPWCGHCNHMKPAWQELADKYSVDTSDIIIARVDASAHRGIGKDYDVNGFPTLKLFTKSNKKGMPYSGPRETDAFQSFLKKNAE